MLLAEGRDVHGQRPNHRLADVMREARVSSKALARAVRALSGGTINCDHTSVSRWLGGTQPRDATARLIAEALSERLGRPVRSADIGLTDPADIDPNLGIDYGPTVASATSALAGLWRADVDDVREIALAPTNSAAWADASLSWLVRTSTDAADDPRRPSRVGAADVASVKATADMFATLDNRFGGGHARRALIQYLRSDVAPMLGASYTDAVGRQLYAATAEATLLAAWMTYDEGDRHGLAQRYFIQALRLAHAADDALLAGSILDAMSHQATFLGRHREAANMARAARAGTVGRATATLTAHFHAMEARALAAGGDAAGAQSALGEAVRVFERRQPGEDPEWIGYFDDTELSAEFSHCFRDLGRASDAVTYAERALAAAGASSRSDFFVTMVLAAGHLARGEVEEACRVAQAALDLGAQLKSGRCVEYLRQFRRQLDAHLGTAAARSLADYGRTHTLWIASSPAT
jgi:tetratricopeptide (TPR) repeat protein